MSNCNKHKKIEAHVVTGNYPDLVYMCDYCYFEYKKENQLINLKKGAKKYYEFKRELRGPHFIQS